MLMIEQIQGYLWKVKVPKTGVALIDENSVEVFVFLGGWPFSTPELSTSVFLESAV